MKPGTRKIRRGALTRASKHPYKWKDGLPKHPRNRTPNKKEKK